MMFIARGNYAVSELDVASVGTPLEPWQLTIAVSGASLGDLSPLSLVAVARALAPDVGGSVSHHCAS